MSLLEKNKPTFEQAIARKIIDPKQIEEWVKTLRTEKKSLVTLNGSFDLLHPGHHEMIHQASLQGDILILLLNTDRSVRKNKGPNRPIQPLNVRLMNAAALELVTYVSSFDETDPRAILEQIRPDVHVNGSEYGKACIEADVIIRHGGRIHIVGLVPGHSSSNIIEKIRSSCD